MKRNVINLLFFSILLLSTIINAQKSNTLQEVPQKTSNDFTRCATDEYNAELLKQYPKMMGSKSYEKIITNQIRINRTNRASSSSRSLVVYTIPVVVHVIHNGEAVGVGTNISDAQVFSQIKVLNDDFRRAIGTNGYNTHTDGADIEVEFCLAKQTPDGCPTNGIDRIDMSAVSTSWDGPSPTGNTQTTLKPTTIWDASKYMNMWSVNFSSSTLLGYAQFPGGSANTDGVVAGYQFFGSNDDPNVTLGGAFNLGRTMTHEVGHYLGLYHTFQGGCNGTGDECADTPAIASDNSGCPSTIPDSCPSSTGLDMIENYMDYTDDACMNIFTNDQKTRIIAAIIAPGNNRPTTLTSNVCNAPASVNRDGSIAIEGISETDCSLSFTPAIRITNWGSATLTSALITYDVDGGSSVNYNWNGSLVNGAYEIFNLPLTMTASGSHTFNATISSPNGSSDQRNCNDVTSSNFNISVSYSTTTQVHLTLTPDNYGSETTWEFRDSSNQLLYSGGPYTNGNTTVINASFNVSSNACYTFTIIDSQNDGICCSYGTGSYVLKTDDNTVIINGGLFTASEITNISTATLGISEYFTNNRVRVYPNPTSGLINVKLAEGNDLPDGYEIYNMLGQMMYKNNVNHVLDLKIDATAFSKGMYFIKIFKEGQSIAIPFIKK